MEPQFRKTLPDLFSVASSLPPPRAPADPGLGPAQRRHLWRSERERRLHALRPLLPGEVSAAGRLAHSYPDPSVPVDPLPGRPALEGACVPSLLVCSEEGGGELPWPVSRSPRLPPPSQLRGWRTHLGRVPGGLWDAVFPTPQLSPLFSLNCISFPL